MRCSQEKKTRREAATTYMIEQAVGFHHHSFKTKEEASVWTQAVLERVNGYEFDSSQREELIKLARGARFAPSSLFHTLCYFVYGVEINSYILTCRFLWMLPLL